jgi:hypothetical protein
MRSSIALSIAVTLWAILVSPASHAGSAKSRSVPTQVTQAADEPVQPARNAVERELVTPLTEKEQYRSRFSRAYIPPRDRRVRILASRKDANGNTFASFAIDEGRAGAPEDSWRKDTITGCVYEESGAVFVNRGKAWYPAAMLLGKTADAAGADVCRASDSRS